MPSKKNVRALPAAGSSTTELALQGSGTGIWDRNVVSGEIRYSPGWKRNLGYSDDEVGNRIEESYGRVHPEDLAMVQQAMRDHFDGNTELYTVEHRIRCKDGSYAWIASRGKVVSRDADGRALRMTGTSTIITQVKEMARQLQQNVELITNLADQVPGLLFQYRIAADGSDTFTYVSAGLAEIYELAPQQMVAGRAIVDALIHPDDLAACSASLLASAANLSQWHQEFRVLLPLQGLRWREGTARPRKLDDGGMLWHGLITDITERKRVEAQLQQIAMIDFLTGLPNRRKFMQCLADEWARQLRQRGTGAALLMFDLDHFKLINDRHGHGCGDAVLQHFSAVLLDGLREIDVAGRIGGEEFAVLLSNTGMAEARLVAQRIQQLLAERPCLAGAERITVTVSIGIAPLTVDGAGIEAALNQADAAMYRAKLGGRNRIEATESQ